MSTIRFLLSPFKDWFCETRDFFKDLMNFVFTDRWSVSDLFILVFFPNIIAHYFNFGLLDWQTWVLVLIALWFSNIGNKLFANQNKE